MKLQTSLEFILILSAISVLLLTVVVYYGSDVKVYAGSDNGIGNNVSFEPPISMITNDSGLLVSVNQTSVVGKENKISMLLYGCANGHASIILASNSSIILQQMLSNINFSDTGIITDYFLPPNIGLVMIAVSYSILCGNNRINGTYSISTFSENIYNSTGNLTGPYANQISAYISQRNESIVYTNLSAEPVYTLAETSHCTYSDFFGNPFPPSWQCPASDSWDYMEFSSSCYSSGASQTETYCIYPVQTGYQIRSANNQDYTYKYNFSIGIYNGTNAYTSRINNSHSSSPVLYNGGAVGSANVTSTYAQPYYPNFDIISNSSSSKFANSSLESEYEQVKTSAFSTFAFYNSSAGADQGTIQQQFSEFNNVAEQLIGSRTSNAHGCSIIGNYLTCSSPYPFQYDINLTLNRRVLQNQTLYAEGSQISIRN